MDKLPDAIRQHLEYQDLLHLLQEVKHFACVQTLLQTYGNQAEAARQLGINRGSFRKHIKKPGQN